MQNPPLVYVARIFAEDNAWLVEFDDCPGCVTFGDTFEEAKARAKEAVEGWLECHVEDGPTPPKPVATEGEPISIDLELSDAIRRLWVE
jgi:predicted RNase H-like HicB family nuclease